MGNCSYYLKQDSLQYFLVSCVDFPLPLITYCPWSLGSLAEAKSNQVRWQPTFKQKGYIKIFLLILFSDII
jgi:hypothetical protein